MERHHFTFTSSPVQHSNFLLKMNTFKTVMICAMLAVSCSGQYASQSSNTQASQPGSSGLSGMWGGQSYASQNQQSVSNSGALPLEQQRPSASPAFADQSTPVAVPAMSAPAFSSPALSAPALSAPALSAPATTQQICSCVTINPAASHAAAAASPAADNSAAPQQTFAAPQQTFAAPQQTFAAPQQSFAAPQQQNAFNAPATAQQQQTYAAQPANTQGRY